MPVSLPQLWQSSGIRLSNFLLYNFIYTKIRFAVNSRQGQLWTFLWSILGRYYMPRGVYGQRVRWRFIISCNKVNISRWIDSEQMYHIRNTHQRWLINAVRSQTQQLAAASLGKYFASWWLRDRTYIMRRGARKKTSISRFAVRNLINCRRNRLLQIKVRYRRHFCR